MAGRRVQLDCEWFMLSVHSALVSVIRCVVSMTVSANSASGSEADKMLWVLLRFCLLATEMSVVVFAIGSGHLDSKRGIRRVIIITSAISLAFSVTQGVLEIQ